jgi:hypothetical protein
MKVSRAQLIRIIKEELARHTVALLEKDGDVGVVDGDEDREGKEKQGKAETKPQNDPDNTSGKPKSSPPKKDQGASDKPQDKSKSPQKKEPSPKKPPTPEPQPGISAADDVDNDANGKGIGDMVVGKSILSFTPNPNSPYVPGGTELTLQFREDPNPLRILISKQGEVRYMYSGVNNNQPMDSVDAPDVSQQGAAGMMGVR